MAPPGERLGDPGVEGRGPSGSDLDKGSSTTSRSISARNGAAARGGIPGLEGGERRGRGPPPRPAAAAATASADGHEPARPPRAAPRWRRSSRPRAGGRRGRRRPRSRPLGPADRRRGGAHEVEPPPGEGALRPQLGGAAGGLLLVILLGGAGRAGGGVRARETGANGGRRSCRAPVQWRKRVGVEPTRDRLTAPPGFEVRTPHRGRFSSDVARRRLAASRGKRSSRCGFTRRRSPRRRVTPWRSRNSRIWIATLRPLSSRSRNCAALKRPCAASRSAAMPPSRQPRRAGRSGRG